MDIKRFEYIVGKSKVTVPIFAHEETGETEYIYCTSQEVFYKLQDVLENVIDLTPHDFEPIEVNVVDFRDFPLSDFQHFI